jgi:predicted dehydrogenase
VTETPLIAVVGCGAWGKNLVRNFHALGALGAVVDPAVGARHRARAIASDVPTDAELAAVLDDERIRGVAIATPAETHVELCLAALDRGKDVFCEKPLALDLDQGARVTERADALSRILMVGHILEYHPGVVRLRRLIAEGALGELRHVHASRLHRGVTRREGDVLFALAPHDLAVVLRLFGALPIAVTTTAGAPLASGNPGVVTMHLAFDGGATAQVYASAIHHVKEQRLVVVGSRRTAVFDDVLDTLTLHDEPIDPSVGRDALGGRAVTFDAAEPLHVECAAFVDAIRTRATPITDGRSALDVLRVIEAAARSLGASGQGVAP